MPRIVGLYAGGVVKERTRRYVPQDNPTTEIVTYTLLDDDSNHQLFIDDFKPNKYYDVGSYMLVPVYIKPYQKRNGSLSYTICIRKDFQTKGEVF